jgi:drug/metabolite transporter (DMT)-like permease
MPFGLLTGLCAALAWGSLDVITALGSRVVGSLRVTAGMQLVTAVIFAALVIVSGTVCRPMRDRSGWRSCSG